MTVSQMSLNHFKLTANLISKEILRFTPAGQSVTECQLHYLGELLEAGSFRKVEMQIPAIAIGAIATELQKIELGQLVSLEGFLTHQSLRRLSLVFHITQINYS
ncbi:MAG: primosomal replication protein N [Betaproteobacteria bacterium]|jgi:primosomal replication protein N